MQAFYTLVSHDVFLIAKLLELRTSCAVEQLYVFVFSF